MGKEFIIFGSKSECVRNVLQESFYNVKKIDIRVLDRRLERRCGHTSWTICAEGEMALEDARKAGFPVYRYENPYILKD